jgi:rubrerythrin|tara:strand:- start:5428 stop:5589 length:162 start_codon:yes stop_codon:yes gene_type:complete
MTKELTKNNNKYYICEECGFAYKDNQTAAKCENWCREKHSCNTEITKDAVKLD